MPPCGSPPPGCPACTRCAPQTGRSGQGAVPPISRAYGVPALAGSWAPFPLFCPGASASTSEAPVVGVGVGHLVRTTSIGPGGPIHSPAGKSFRSAWHPPSPEKGAIAQVGQVRRGQRPACRRRHQAVEVVRRDHLVVLSYRNVQEFQELGEADCRLPAQLPPLLLRALAQAHQDQQLPVRLSRGEGLIRQCVP